jgi:hypothetical protein
MMQRVMLLLVSCAALAMIAVALGVRPPAARPVLACTGGGSGLEDAAVRARYIVLGDAVEVGGAMNRAPTIAPTATPTVTATVRAGTPVPTPPSPPQGNYPRQPAYSTPEGFTLAGFGVTIRTVRAYAGTLPEPQAPQHIDKEVRASIEREIREFEAGRGIGDCELGRFTFKFEQGARYLVFATDEEPEFGLLAIFRLRVVGNDVLLHDPLATTYDPGGIYLSAPIYHRFFAGVGAEMVGGDNDIVRITAERVPLAAVLRAIAYVRGDPSIAPPDTGSAGLASGRR